MGMMLWHDVLDRHMEERKIIIIISNHLVKPTGYLTTFSSLHQYGMYYHRTLLPLPETSEAETRREE